MSKDVVLVGFSGHAWVLAETAFLQGFNLVGYTEIKEISISNDFLQSADWLNLRYLGNEMDGSFTANLQHLYLLGTGDNALRERIFRRLMKLNAEFLTLISADASVKLSAQLGVATVVLEGAIVQTFARIGKGCIINSGSVVEHECVLGDFVHVAPGAVLAGNVVVGDGAFIGANAVVKQGVKIGKHAVIGAGSVVIRDVNEGETVVGNPAKKLDK